MNNYFDMEQTKFEKTVESNTNMEYEMPAGMNGCCMNQCNTMCPPIQECPQERVCHRFINYEVPHIIPCNTRIINHHIYRHTYTPCYTTCEENVCANIYDGKCC